MTDHIDGLIPLTAREIVRSLHSGVVPAHGSGLFSYGRDRWLRSIEIDLEDLASSESRVGRVRIINGRNGDGKTHLMHLISQLALNKGFAVAYVVISELVPLSKWDRVYREVARSIRVPSGAQGVKAILDPKAPAAEVANRFRLNAASVRNVAGLDADFATAVYRYTTEQTVNVDSEQDLHHLAAWIEGGETPPMRHFGISSKVNEANGAAALRSLVRVLRHFGIPGVVLMVDEVESTLSLSTTRRRDCYQTLRLLVDGSTTDAHSLVVLSTTPPMYSDEVHGLRSYPALWSRIRSDDGAGGVNYNGTFVDLTKTPLSADDYESIGRSIARIYATAWGTADLWDVISSKVREAAELAASGRLTMTFSATRVFVKLISDLLRTVDETGQIPTSMDNLIRTFGHADADLQELAVTE